MKHKRILAITSLLAILFMAFHLADDIVGGNSTDFSGVFFWIWTLMALGVTAIFSFILSVQGLWSLRRSQSRKPSNVTDPSAAQANFIFPEIS